MPARQESQQHAQVRILWKAGCSFSALPRETQSNSDTELGKEGKDVQAGTMLHISQNTTPQPPSFLL